MSKKQDDIPKVGDLIYLNTSLYVTHGLENVIITRL